MLIAQKPTPSAMYEQIEVLSIGNKVNLMPATFTDNKADNLAQAFTYYTCIK